MASVSRPLLAAAIASAVWLAACTRDPAPQALIASARAYLAAHEPGAAVIQLKNALQQQPDDAEARFLLGRASLEIGDAVAAGAQLRRAIDLGHPAAQAVPLLAQAQLAEGKWKEVIREHAGTALPEAAATAALKALVATAYRAAGRPDQAQATIGEALAADPASVPAQLVQARLLAGGPRHGEALAIVERLTRSAPDDADVWRQQGDLQWHGQGELAAAAEAYRRALAIRPGHVQAQAALAGLLLALGDLAAAAAEADALRKLPGQRTTATFFDAQRAFQAGDKAGAYERVREVLKAAPDSPSALQLAGAIELGNRQLLAAERSLTKALQRAPDLVLARQLLAQTYLRSGQPEKALATLSPLLAAAQPGSASLSLAGEAHLQAGAPEKAEAAFRQALAADPGSTRTRTALAWLQWEKDPSDAALGQLRSVAAGDDGTLADMALIAAHLRAGQVARALDAIGRLEAKQPDRPDGAYLRGTVLLRQRDAAGARASFERALAIDAAYMPAVSRLAALDMAEGRADQALSRFDTVLAADPGSVQALLGLSALRERTGAPPAQVAAPLLEAVRRHPGDVQARLRLVEHHLARQEHTLALDAAQQAVGAVADSEELLDALGRAQMAAGDTEQAAATFGKLASLAPQTPQPHLRLAAVNLSRGQAGTAARHLRNALEIAPDFLPAQQMLMGLELREKRYAQALDVARTVQRQRPQDLSGFLWEADIQAARSDAAGAAALYRGLLERFDRAEAAVRLHAALLEARRPKDAEALAHAWQARHPDDAAFALHLGDAALARDDLPAAAAHFTRAVQRQPGHAGAWNNLAWVTARQGRPGAVAHARKAVALQPGTPALLDTLAFSLAGERQFDEAIAVQKEALALAPGDAALRLGLAKLLVRAGHREPARAELQALAALGDRFGQQPEVQRLLAGL
ncbi:XrtA/PEP-CTERM system TPR-repeat protein PrsT [Aquincola sp. MAHUQ-54]|uniref:XrtA/PEP-CTERM system TPR-repeat protein PrsT n=1 Tax=Aquincola agrisoli TaxID=3119538 RepID=A0AAW9QMJ3_9BURK